ncbi:hypothetical protein DSO57_1005611 [Entomophthora muscae]|uniref:Uncharacterized protein n=1 Tax=Entomophthora muscae TaxID=34485 RepID=A0ACC2RMY0_9FUNG|nr:hypothetical protein DSO57_1005611 [Entomophthora muscae]
MDAASTDQIILHMPEHNWLYAAAKNMLLYKFGSIALVTERKNEFLMISFRKNETIADFADCFYLEAQILTSSGLLTVHDAHIALRAACSDTFGPPNTGSKPCLVSSYPGRSEAPINNKSLSKPDITKVICHHCNQKESYASSCNSKTGIHTLPPLVPEVQGKVNVE